MLQRLCHRGKAIGDLCRESFQEFLPQVYAQRDSRRIRGGGRFLSLWAGLCLHLGSKAWSAPLGQAPGFEPFIVHAAILTAMASSLSIRVTFHVQPQTPYNSVYHVCGVGGHIHVCASVLTHAYGYVEV